MGEVVTVSERIPQNLLDVALLSADADTARCKGCWVFTLDFWNEMVRAHLVDDIRMFANADYPAEMTKAAYQAKVRLLADEVRLHIESNEICRDYLVKMVEFAIRFFAFDDKKFFDSFIGYSMHSDYFPEAYRICMAWRGFLLYLQMILLAYRLFGLPDGTYEVSLSDIVAFYRVNGLTCAPSSGRKRDERYFAIKRSDAVLFMKQGKTKLSLLDGAKTVIVEHQDLSYYEEYLTLYVTGIKSVCDKYYAVMDRLSDEVRSIGGDGRVHGCIVDINFYNHIFVNPLDGKMTPYQAWDVRNRYIYSSVALMAKKEKTFSLPNADTSQKNELTLTSDSYPLLCMAGSHDKRKRPVYDNSKGMYDVSRVFFKMQQICEHNIVRIWNDDLLARFIAETQTLLCSDDVLLSSDMSMVKIDGGDA